MTMTARSTMLFSYCSGELARKSTWTCLTCSTANRAAPALTSSPHGIGPRSHQRRPSSSKASNPPKTEVTAITTPSNSSNKAVAGEAKSASTAASEASDKRSSARAVKKRSKGTERDAMLKATQSNPWNLPSVPSTQNLHPLNVHLASFFSTHRPFSITNAIPPPSSESAFTSLFEARPTPKSATSDVINTLSSALERLEGATSQQPEQDTSEPSYTPEEVDLHTAVTQASYTQAPSQNINSPAKTFHINLQDLAKKFRPYVPPPPPVPLAAMQEAAQQTAKAEKRKQSAANRKSYRTTLTIHESVLPNGEKTYKTHSSPIIVLPSPSSADSSDKHLPSRVPREQSFLGRMRQRQFEHEDRMCERTGSETWRAISVKRQRKLKMKKHKYKKLMKRTKNLRRRLDRT